MPEQARNNITCEFCIISYISFKLALLSCKPFNVHKPYLISTLSVNDYNYFAKISVVFLFIPEDVGWCREDVRDEAAHGHG